MTHQIRSLICPECGANNTQALAIVYSSGTQTNSQNEIARQLSPPVDEGHKPEHPFYLLAGFIGMVVGIYLGLEFAASYLMMAITIIALIAIFITAAAFLFRGRYVRRKNAFQLALDDWRRSQLCMRCGHTFLR